MASLSVGQVSALIAAGTAVGMFPTVRSSAQRKLTIGTSSAPATFGDTVDSHRIHQQEK